MGVSRRPGQPIRNCVHLLRKLLVQTVPRLAIASSCATRQSPLASRLYQLGCPRSRGFGIQAGSVTPAPHLQGTPERFSAHKACDAPLVRHPFDVSSHTPPQRPLGRELRLIAVNARHERLCRHRVLVIFKRSKALPTLYMPRTRKTSRAADGSGLKGPRVRPAPLRRSRPMPDGCLSGSEEGNPRSD